MSSLFSSIKTIDTVERLADGDTIIHKIHPFVKIIISLVYIILVVSVKKYNIDNLLAFFLYPIIIFQIIKVPSRYIVKRILFVLPFSIMAGISNIIFEREIAIKIMNVSISYGVISFTSLILKTILTVLAVIILVVSTPMNMIFSELRRLKVPSVITTQLMFTYKYISLIAREGKNMYLSYSLRKGESKGIYLKDIGMFLGQLILRSFERAERLYIAMKCRGYDEESTLVSSNKKINIYDLLYLLFMCSIFIFFRQVNIFNLIGNLLGI